MKILVTNDDGIDSVLFPPLVDIAATFGETFLCLPREEQSWRGKSMTRLGKIKITTGHTRDGREALTPNGTPADCVRYAHEVHLGVPTDVVFSGINYGLNAGIGYLSSSGTAGACFEGNLLNIPGICVSQELSPAVWKYHLEYHTLPPGILEKVVAQAKRILLPTIKKILATEEFFKRPLTWSINLPFEPKTDTVTMAPVSPTRYEVDYAEPDADGCTKMVEAISIPVEQNTPSDTTLVKSGYPTVTIIDLFSIGQLREDYARKVALHW